MNLRFLAILAFVAGALLAAGVVSPAQSAEARRDPATVTLAADLRRAPDAGAPVLATLAAGQQVTVLDMRGSLAKVDAAGQVGWMAAAKLRIGAAAAPAAASGGGSDSGASWLRGLTGMLGGSSSSGGDSKVPIGVRGLQKEDLASARPDPDAVDRMEAYRASPDEGLAYASAAGLASRPLEYRASPASTSSSGAAPASRAGRDN